VSAQTKKSRLRNQAASFRQGLAKQVSHAVLGLGAEGGAGPVVLARAGGYRFRVREAHSSPALAFTYISTCFPVPVPARLLTRLRAGRRGAVNEPAARVIHNRAGKIRHDGGSLLQSSDIPAQPSLRGPPQMPEQVKRGQFAHAPCKNIATTWQPMLVIFQHLRISLRSDNVLWW